MSSAQTQPESDNNAASPRGHAFPLEFNAKIEWRHIEYNHPHAQANMTEDKMSVAVAYQCINARGAIAHGKAIQNYYNNDQVENISISLKSAKEIFSAFGGTAEFCGPEQIKQELAKNGPVVSTSFSPTPSFLRNNAIGESDICKQSDLLIVGWQQLSVGEVWIAQPLGCKDGFLPKVVCIAIGQCSIDNLCIAPKCTLENRPWEPGPYYDANVDAVESEWRTWMSMTCYHKSMSELDSLFKEIGAVGLGSGPGYPVITARNKNKIAHSRKAYLQQIKHVNDQFEITLGFMDTL